MLVADRHDGSDNGDAGETYSRLTRTQEPTKGFPTDMWERWIAGTVQGACACGRTRGMTRWRTFSVLLVVVFAALVAMIGVTRAENPPEGPRARGHSESMRTVPITVGNRTIMAVIADTEPARIRGLLGWASIRDDTGMLLDFVTEGEYAIHMQGMKFPIDALWIDSTGAIKLVYEDIRPNSGMTYPSMFPCRYCLEINAGFCRRYGVKIGQSVRFGVPENHPR
jgi:uncharacterized membrane protein (UPF0127 family)